MQQLRFLSYTFDFIARFFFGVDCGHGTSANFENVTPTFGLCVRFEVNLENVNQFEFRATLERLRGK